MQNYKDLSVWKKSHLLTLKTYKISERLPKEELFGLGSQIKRSTSSIPMNIAEGCGKYTQTDLARFLNISLGSANEAEYTFLLLKDLGMIEFKIFEEVNNDINEIKAMLISLIRKVRSEKQST